MQTVHKALKECITSKETAPAAAAEAPAAEVPAKK